MDSDLYPCTSCRIIDLGLDDVHGWMFVFSTELAAGACCITYLACFSPSVWRLCVSWKSGVLVFLLLLFLFCAGLLSEYCSLADTKKSLPHTTHFAFAEMAARAEGFRSKWGPIVDIHQQ